MKKDENDPDHQHVAQEQKYLKFKDWFEQNGGFERKINFPVLFEPGTYLGINAKNEIKPNEVILAVPKKLTIGLSTVRESELKQIIEQHDILSNEQDDDSDYNMLCLFLIMQKMKGEKSFYHPYLQLLDSSETLMNWKDSQIESLKDPFINLKFIDSIRGTFQPVFAAFVSITNNNKHIFPLRLTRKMFDETYAVVMTRGFGWGLPETMMVPYADFLNHSSTGVNHYVFDRCLEDKQNAGNYIKKKFQLDLGIFPEINNEKLLPIGYEQNIRQKYVSTHKQKLKSMNLSFGDDSIRMDPQITNPLYNILVESVVNEDFEEELCLSTDSEDNDSDSEDEAEQNQRCQGTSQQPGQFKSGGDASENLMKPTSSGKMGTILMERKYLKYAFKQVENDLNPNFTEPKPLINVEFEQDVKFQWWFDDHSKKNDHKDQPEGQKQLIQGNSNEKDTSINISGITPDNDKYFIVSSSKKIYPNQQIFNCYGRRSNRFLLIWYGFCFQNNKYDSVPFRIWSQEIAKKIGKAVSTRYLTQKQYKDGIPVGNERFNPHMLSVEFRLKNKRINYKLIAYLRYRYLKAHRIYREFYKLKGLQINKITSIQMELQCFDQYQSLLDQLVQDFGLQTCLIEKNNHNLNQKTIQAKSARQYFAQILQKSNEQIILRNILAVKQVLKLLHQIEKFLAQNKNRREIDNSTKEKDKTIHQSVVWQEIPKEKMLEFYKNTFRELSSQEIILFEKLQSITNSETSQLLKDLKIMVREYFKILSESIICCTFYSEFF